MAAVIGDSLEPEPVTPWVVVRIAARRSLQLGFDQRQAHRLGRGHGALEPGCPPPVIDRRAEALELITRRVVQAAADEQSVERQLEVERPGPAGNDRDPDALLQRRSTADPP